MRTILTLALVAAAHLGAAVELPPTLAKAIADNEARREAAAERYRKAMDKVYDDVLAVVQREFSLAMKGEDLPLSKALQGLKQQLETERAALVEPGAGQASDAEIITALTDNTWVAKLEGREFEFTFGKDGKCKIAGADFGGTWRDLPAKGKVEVKWETADKADFVVYNAKNTNWKYEKTNLRTVAFRPKEEEEKTLEDEIREEARERWEEWRDRRDRARDARDRRRRR